MPQLGKSVILENSTIAGAVVLAGANYTSNSPGVNAQAQVIVPGVAGKSIYFHGMQVQNVGSAPAAGATSTVSDGTINIARFVGTTPAGSFSTLGTGISAVFARLPDGATLTGTVTAGGVNSQYVLILFWNQF